jgi:hypothetical protein
MTGDEPLDGVVSGSVALTLAGGPLLAPVLARVVRAAGAMAGLDLDRLSDATLAADAVADVATGLAPDAPLRVYAVRSPEGLDLCFGPFGDGQAEEVRRRTSLPGLGPVVEGLADEILVQTGPDGQRLVLRFILR